MLKCALMKWDFLQRQSFKINRGIGVIQKLKHMHMHILFLCYYYTDGCHWLLNQSYVCNYFDSESYSFCIEIKRNFLLSPVQKHLKSIFAYRTPNWRKPATLTQFFPKQSCLKIEEMCCIASKRKTAKNEWENDDWLSSSFTQCI